MTTQKAQIINIITNIAKSTAVYKKCYILIKNIKPLILFCNNDNKTQKKPLYQTLVVFCIYCFIKFIVY